MLLHQLGEYDPATRAEAIRRFGVDRGPGILAVVERSPAAAAGLRAGDVLLKANGRPMPPPATAAAEREENARRRLMNAADALLDEELARGPARLSLLREGRPLEVRLAASPGCLPHVRLARSAQANAFADGRYAIMTTKLLGFFRNDDELAVALAHELAHNILGHPAALDAAGVPQGILRNVGANAARVLKTEEEADRLGIKLVWAAGYDVRAAIPFWRRLYATYDPIPVPKLFRTHPSLGARERMIEATLAELRASEPGAQ
jgi:Zn-dependent protease with chaperone function